MSTEMRVNGDITAKQVRLIIPETQHNAIVSIVEARRTAEDMELDLVQINEDTVPVCKVMDYGRFLYESKVAQKQRAKQQRTAVAKVKEVQLSVDIGTNDAEVKRKQVRKFLDQGLTVKIVLRVTGRAKHNPDMMARAKDRMEMFVQDIPGKFAFVQTVQLNSDTYSAIINTRNVKDKEA